MEEEVAGGPPEVDWDVVDAIAAAQTQTADPSAPDAQSLSPGVQGPAFLTHDEERFELGKPLWNAISAQMPRAQHDGSLAMP